MSFFLVRVVCAGGEGSGAVVGLGEQRHEQVDARDPFLHRGPEQPTGPHYQLWARDPAAGR